MSKKRITSVNYTESLSNNDSVFVNQGDILRQISKTNLLNSVQSQINSLQTQLNNLKSEINALDGEINTLDNEVNALDSEINTHSHDYLPLSGGTLTGALSLNGGATVPTDKGIHFGGNSDAYPYIYGYAGKLYISINGHYWVFGETGITKDNETVFPFPN